MSDIYDRIRYSMLTGNFVWADVDMRLVAWSGDLDFDATDDKVSDIVARANAVPIGYSLPVTGLTVTVDGRAQTDPIVIPDVAFGQELTFFTFVDYDDGDEENSAMVLFIDDAFELPFATNGMDIVVQPDWIQERGWWRP